MEEITKIHDRFFRETFSRMEIAQGFLDEYLPDEIRTQLDLSTLDIVKDSFIDKELREHRSDITYTVRMQDVLVYLYLLFEHKSFPDPLTGFQLLRYIVRLGEHHFQQNPKSKKFPPVFPMVFYHGKTKWKIPVNFQHLVELKKYSPLKLYTPEFCFRVYDISHLKDDEIRGRSWPVWSCSLQSTFSGPICGSVFRKFFPCAGRLRIVRPLWNCLKSCSDTLFMSGNMRKGKSVKY